MTQRGFALIAAVGFTALALAGHSLSGCHPAAPQGATTPESPADSAPQTATASTAPGSAGPGPADATAQAGAQRSYSPFGSYQPLPSWSGWCGLQPDGTKCAAPLTQAVKQQTPQSRPTVRGHGWHLWSSIWAPISAGSARNDPKSKRTNLYGTTGCWAKLEDGSAACSGFYPIWMTWPNNGRPHSVGGLLEAPASESGAATTTHSPTFGGQTLLSRRRAHGIAPALGDPNPTQVQTVNTKAPTYALPPLTLSKQCGMTTEQAKAMLAQKQYEKIEEACKTAGAPGVFCPPQSEGQAPAICDGTAFVDQGDVMIATESLSVEAYDDIRGNKLGDEEELKKLYAAKTGSIGKKIGDKFISTKHMFWPVKGCRPGSKVGDAGCRIRYGALPPWVPKNFKNISYSTNADYLGYEQWKNVVAIDTCKGTGEAPCPPGGAATLALEYVSGAHAIVTQNPKLYAADDFLHIQISEEVLKGYFTATDRALLDQAMVWAYGDKSNGFEPGDFLVVAAMHVNTKEIPSWSLQSVWWSPMNDTLADCPLGDFNHCFGQTGGYAATAPGSKQPNEHSGLTASQLDTIDAQVGTGWRDHYLMTDSYGINFELDGTPVTAANYFKGKPPAWATTAPSGQPMPLFPVSCNVYIEPVIHPLGTDCQNCHRRAGYPDKSCAKSEYAGGCGRANYQTAQCGSLLGDYGSPQSDLCMTQPWAWHDAKGNHCKTVDGSPLCTNNDAYPVLDTDWIWLIADLHAKQPPPH